MTVTNLGKHGHQLYLHLASAAARLCLWAAIKMITHGTVASILFVWMRVDLAAVDTGYNWFSSADRCALVVAVPICALACLGAKVAVALFLMATAIRSSVSPGQV